MEDEIAVFKKYCETLAQHRAISVGMPLDTSFLISWPIDVQSSADFAKLVSAAYQMWLESWKLDIGFLLSHRSNGAARDFDHLIHNLRTSQQHSDNSVADRRFTSWAKEACNGHDPATAEDWLSCGKKLMIELNAEMNILCETAARGDRSFRFAWQAKVSESPEAIVTQVASDLGLQLSTGQRGYHARQVERRWKNYYLRPHEIPNNVLASFAEQSLIARVGPLPFLYQDVLAELRVLGSRDAVSALHLAHAVAEITEASGDAYINRLKDVWTSLHI